MKLDYDLIRKILLDIEDKGEAKGYDRVPDINGYSHDEIFYVTKRMDEAGLIILRHKKNANKSFYPSAHIDDITLKGHEFLENSRNSKLWENAKKTALDRSISWTIDNAIKIMSKLASHQIDNL